MIFRANKEIFAILLPFLSACGGGGDERITVSTPVFSANYAEVQTGEGGPGFTVAFDTSECCSNTDLLVGPNGGYVCDLGTGMMVCSNQQSSYNCEC